MWNAGSRRMRSSSSPVCVGTGPSAVVTQYPGHTVTLLTGGILLSQGPSASCPWLSELLGRWPPCTCFQVPPLLSLLPPHVSPFPGPWPVDRSINDQAGQVQRTLIAQGPLFRLSSCTELRPLCRTLASDGHTSGHTWAPWTPTFALSRLLAEHTQEHAHACV